MLRKLRIAFSAGCGLAFLLLIMLWIGSYGKSHRTFRVGDIGWRSEQGVVTAWSPFDLVDDGTHVERDVTVEWFSAPKDKPVALEWNVNVLGLHFSGPGSVWILDVPYWLAVLPTGALAAAPWIKWSRRFSLRTLLIVTTLFAAALGTVVVHNR